MKELEKYSLSDLFHIKDYLKERISYYPDDEDDYGCSNWKKEKQSLSRAEREIIYEIEDRMKIVIENIEKEFYNDTSC